MNFSFNRRSGPRRFRALALLALKLRIPDLDHHRAMGLFLDSVATPDQDDELLFHGKIILRVS